MPLSTKEQGEVAKLLQKVGQAAPHESWRPTRRCAYHLPPERAVLLVVPCAMRATREPWQAPARIRTAAAVQAHAWLCEACALIEPGVAPSHSEIFHTVLQACHRPL